MAKFTKKISPLVSRQFPEHIQANNPLLVEFVKQYYRFMDSAQITLSSVTASDQILLETATESFLALDGTDEKGNNANDYILNDKLFVTHLKGGFSEKKLSYKENMIGLIPKFSNAHQVTMYLETLNNTLL